MSDEFPTTLLKDAVPPADRNMAGRKPENMNMTSSPYAPPPPPPAAQPAAPAKRIRKKPAAAPAQAAPPMRMIKPNLPQDPAKLQQINQTIDTLGAGKIKHGEGRSPYANYDPFADTQHIAEGGIIALPPAQPGGPVVPSDEELMVQENARTQGAQPVRPAVQHVPSGITSRDPSPFLQQTCRVTMELTDGMMTISAIAVKESPYSVVMLLKITPDGTIFIPKPATKLRLSMKDKAWDVYFPGAYIEIEEMGLALMVFIKAEGSDGKA